MNGTTAEKHVALYTVVVEGAALDDELSKRIREVRVVDYLMLPDVCTFSIGFPKGREGEPEPIDQHPFDIGKRLEIRLGAREALVTTTLFRGEIVTLEPQFAAGGVELLVRAFDRSHRLHRSRRTRTFQNQTISDIVAKVVTEAGFEARCEASGSPLEFMQQNNETDWDYVWRLAQRIGFEFVIEDGTAHFRRPAAVDPVQLEWPKTVRSFRPRLTSVQQVDAVSVRAFDPKTKTVIESQASSPRQIAQIGVKRDEIKNKFAGATVHVATEPATTSAEADAIAQALLDRLANAYIAADGVTEGNPRIKAGVTVRVTGVGTRFSGTYRVQTSTHVLRGGSTYETHFANSPVQTISGMVAGDRRPTAIGDQLVIAEVTNNDDPAGMGRVRVWYPTLEQKHEGWWARVAAPSAGKERGMLMLPVVGEEVLVGFEHGDTTRPYVLGSLFNGKDTPGEALLQDQDGSFALKSDKRIYTESKEDYTIKSDKRLLVEVADDVEESYARDWTNGTTGKTSLKASQPFEIEGQSVTITGMTTLELKCGPASIKLSSAGVTVSGPMINLG
ncbi:MAG: VgrG-related protein [Actinomycetota bacterium]|nr:VgrG-related protein [Actinomycetota bacterium]